MERVDVSVLALLEATRVKSFSSKGQLSKLKRLIVVGGISVLLLLVAFLISGAENVLQRLVSFSPLALAGILALLIANLFLVTYRLWRVLGHYGFPLPWNVAFRASISGHLVGLFVMSLFGQVLGRQVVLRLYGVRSVVVASLAAYERALLGLISGAMCVLGVAFLPGPSVAADYWHLVPFSEIALVIVGGIFLRMMLGWSRFETRLAARIQSWSACLCLVECVGVTFISQFLMLGSFVLGVQAIQPGVDIISLFAAAAVISFAASIPVTVNGWGVRELTAVYVLGLLGVSAADAVAVSVLIGLCSTVVILVASPFSFKKMSAGDASAEKSPPLIRASGEVEKASAWILAMAAAVLVFFQLHLELPASLGLINLNMADPVAILALAAVSIHALSVRRFPVWRVQSFNVILALISLGLLMAFLRGVMEIGVTQWAFAGRLLGWMALLGYLSAGYLMVAYAGVYGLRRMTETLIATGVVVVVLKIILRLLMQGGWIENASIRGNFEGYAANRNAFVFQMLVCVSLVLAYSSVRARRRTIGHASPRISSRTYGWASAHLFPSLLGVVLLGVILSGSRAGWLVCVVILLVAWIGQLADRRVIVWGLICAIVFWGMISIVGAIQGGALLDIVLKGSAIQSAISSEGSGHEHRESMIRALELWVQSPVFGAGLGVFIEKSPAWFGHSLVVHSTPLWILAEFGMVGALVFGWAFFMVARSAFKFDAKSSAHRALGLLLLSFAGFCLVHEIFYQRIFWLVLGAMLAYPGTRGGLPQELDPPGVHILSQKQVARFAPSFGSQAGLASTGVDQETVRRESPVPGKIALPRSDLQSMEQGPLAATELAISAMDRSDTSIRNRR